MGEALPALLWAPWACQAHGRAPDGAGTGRRGVSTPWDLTWAGNQDRHVPRGCRWATASPLLMQGNRGAERLSSTQAHPAPGGAEQPLNPADVLGRIQHVYTCLCHPNSFQPRPRAGWMTARKIPWLETVPSLLLPCQGPGTGNLGCPPPPRRHPFHVRAAQQTARLPASRTLYKLPTGPATDRLSRLIVRVKPCEVISNA